MTADGTGTHIHTYTYDAENRVTSIDSGAWAYAYDSFGRRIERTDSSGNHYDALYDLAGHLETEYTNGSWDRTEIYAGGMHLATYVNSTNETYFHHADWLGSERVTTDSSGTSKSTCSVLPFGDGISCTQPLVNQFFTGDEHDAESNTEHTLFRQMSGTQGRWLSPDPYMGSMDIGNPQSFNRYAYVVGDPINMADSSGLIPNFSFRPCGTIEGIAVPCSVFLHLASGEGVHPCVDLTDCYGYHAHEVQHFASPNGRTYDFVDGHWEYRGQELGPDSVNELGLPAQLPTGTPQQFWGPFTDGFNAAIKDLGKKQCSAFFGGQGISTMKATEYRFVPLSNPNYGAQTNSPTSVFVNSTSSYMTYEGGGGSGPFGRSWTQSQFRAFILLHELGHQLSPTTGFQADASNLNLNQAQSRRVIGACF